MISNPLCTAHQLDRKRKRIILLLLTFSANTNMDAVNSTRLGESPNFRWNVNKTDVDMTYSRPMKPFTITTEGQRVTADAHRTALIVVDMQNDFCEYGGWLDEMGVDISPERTPIKPLGTLIPKAREAGITIIWLNWGNRPDKLNLFPNTIWIGKPDGSQIGYGDKVKNQSKILEKGEWGSAVVEPLNKHIKPVDVCVDKYRFSGFWDTPLESILKNLEIKTIFFTGVNTDQCVYHTLADANFLGYGCVLVKDCVASTSPQYVQDATIWQVKTSFGFVANSSDIVAGLEVLESN